MPSADNFRLQKTLMSRRNWRPRRLTTAKLQKNTKRLLPLPTAQLLAWVL